MFPTCEAMILVSLTVLFGVGQGHTLVQKQFGVKMCDRRCYNTVGCSSFVYIRSTMACYTDGLPNMTATSGKERWTFNISKVKDIGHEDLGHSCNKNWRIFRCRSDKYKCLRRSRKRNNRLNLSESAAGIKSRGAEVKMSTLLLLPYGASFCTVHQMNIHDFLVREFTFNCDKSVNAAVYVQMYKKLTVARKDGIYSADIHANNQTLLKKKTLIYSLSIDEHEKLLFYYTWESRTLWSMHIEKRSKGKDLEMFFCTKPCPTALDTKRKIIYVNTIMKTLFSVDYDGGNRKVLVRCRSCLGPGLAFDVTKGDLYYSKGGKLRKQSFTANKSMATILNSRAYYLQSLSFYEGRLFVSYCKSGEGQATIETISGATQTRVEYTQTGGQSRIGIIVIP